MGQHVSKAKALAVAEEPHPHYLQCTLLAISLVTYMAYLYHVLRSGSSKSISLTLLLGGFFTYVGMFWKELASHRRWYILAACLFILVILGVICYYKFRIPSPVRAVE